MTFSWLHHLVVMVSIVTGLLGLSGLSGCAQSPERQVSISQPVSTTVNREKLALDLKNRGELAEALIQWKILATIEPSNTNYETQIDATRQLIDKKSKQFILDGIANLRQGAREAARLSFLRALALNPKNSEAFNYLRQLTIRYPAIGQNSGWPDDMCCMNYSANGEGKE